MTESQLTVRVGLGFIGSHLLIFLAITWAWVGGGMTFSEYLTATTVIVPLFTGYTVLIAGHFHRTRLDSPLPDERKVSNAWASTVVLLVGFFVLALLAAVIGKATNVAFKDFDQFKVTLLLIESLFAGLCSFAIRSLFRGPDGGH